MDHDKKLIRLKEDTYRFACRSFTQPEPNTLGKRLIKYRTEMYTFVDYDLEPTNNNAEREIRPAVLMRKTWTVYFPMLIWDAIGGVYGVH